MDIGWRHWRHAGGQQLTVRSPQCGAVPTVGSRMIIWALASNSMLLMMMGRTGIPLSWKCRMQVLFKYAGTVQPCGHADGRVVVVKTVSVVVG